jgi:hypothetical protein
LFVFAVRHDPPQRIRRGVQLAIGRVQRADAEPQIVGRPEVGDDVLAFDQRLTDPPGPQRGDKP